MPVIVLGCQTDQQGESSEQTRRVERMFVIQSMGRQNFLLHQCDLDELQSGVLTQSVLGQWCQSPVHPYQIPVDSQTIQTLLTLIRMSDKSDRLRLAKELPVHVQRQLCKLYDYLMCRGVFANGVQDAANLYAPLLVRKNFLSTYAGQESGLLCQAEASLLPYTVPYVEPIKHKALTGHESFIRRLVYSFDGKLLASGCDDDTIRIWNTETDELIQVLRGHTKWIMTLAFSQDSKLLASGSGDHTICLWDMQSFQLVRVLIGHNHWVEKVLFGPDGRLLISCGDRTIRVWQVASSEQLRVLTSRARVTDMALSSDGKTVVSYSWDDGVGEMPWNKDGEVALWDITTGVCRWVSQYGNYITEVAFSHDGRCVAAHCDSNIKVWHARTGRLVYDDTGSKTYTNVIRGVAFSPDSTLLVCWASGGTIQIIDIAKRTIRYTVEAKFFCTDYVHSLSFSPDGQMMASGYDNGGLGKICLWHVATGSLLRKFGEENSLGEQNVVFSPDGKKLASSDTHYNVYQFDLNGGLNVRQLMLVLKAAHAPQLHSADQQHALEEIYHTLPEKPQEFVVSRIEGIF